MEERCMRAGAGKAAIGLDGILPFDGFDAQRHDICARALVVEGGRDRVCILTLEITSISADLLADLRGVVQEATGCAGACAWVVPTHTFSAPHVRTSGHLSDNAERERNDRYRIALIEAAREAAERAAANLEPVELAVADGQCPVNVNRDVETPAGWWLGTNPQGYADHAMPVLVMKNEDARIVAVLGVADVQSSVLDGSRDSEGRRMVSGDLFGFAAQALERELGCVALLLPGAAGDQAPLERAMTFSFDPDGTKHVEDAHEDGYRMLHVQGCALVDALIDAARAAEPVEGVDIDARSVEAILPGQVRADFATLAPHRSYEFHEAGEQKTRVYLLRMGAVELVGIQPEAASSFGSAVRAARPGRVLFATLVNGAQKYLPAPDAYEKITYEAMNSGFAAGAHEQLLANILAALGGSE